MAEVTVTEDDKDRLAGTNLENYGSKEHRELRAKAAQGERAWDGVKDMEEGVRVWRINQFNVEDWPKDDYGEFFNGDSYIVLNAYKEEDKTLYNVHFWLGSETTQDEAGTAAYKTVEIDDLLGDLPVQYREVEGHESKQFKSLFRGGIKILTGGAETGFRHVETNAVDYKPRLLRMKQEGSNKKKVTCTQVPLSVDELSTSDCFILDTPKITYQFRPENASVWEKRLTNKIVEEIFEMRNGRVQKMAIDWGEESEDAKAFWEYFGGQPEALPEESKQDAAKSKEEELYAGLTNTMYRVSDADGTIQYETLKSGVFDKDEFVAADYGQDVVIVDVGRRVYVWLGKSCSKEEKGAACFFADKLLRENGRPFWTPIVRVVEGSEPAEFWQCFGVDHVSA